MCIIRQLINRHSIIDSYPMFLVDKTPKEQTRTKPQDDSLTDPPTDMSDSSSHNDESSSTILDDDEMEVNRPKEETILRKTACPAIISEKIAQDVMVFRKIIDIMPPQSLLHLIRADVLVTVDPTSPVPEIVADTNNQEQHKANSSTTATPDVAPVAPVVVIDAQDQVAKESAPEPRLAPYRASKVRFACDQEGKLLCEVQHIDRSTDKSLWWRKDEMQEIRADCCLLVEEYVHFKGEFERDVTFLMDCANDTKLSDHDEKELAFFRDHDVVRGLERHIVTEFDTVKQTHFEAIMEAQHVYKERGATERWKHIKKTSIANSLPTRFIAVRFAQNDADLVHGSPSERASRSSQADEETSTAAVSTADASPEVSSSLIQRTQAPGRRKLRSFIARTVSRRFSGTG